MRSNLENSIYNIRALIENKEAALSRNISNRARASIQKEIDILDKMLLDIAENEIKEEEIKYQEHKAILILKDQILAMESICILHGIYDFPVWLNKGPAVLFNEALRFYKNKIVQTPLKLR